MLLRPSVKDSMCVDAVYANSMCFVGTTVVEVLTWKAGACAHPLQVYITNLRLGFQGFSYFFENIRLDSTACLLACIYACCLACMQFPVWVSLLAFWLAYFCMLSCLSRLDFSWLLVYVGFCLIKWWSLQYTATYMHNFIQPPECDNFQTKFTMHYIMWCRV